MTTPNFKKFNIEAYKPGKSKVKKLNNVIKLSDSVVFGSFVVFEDEDVFDFLMPDRKVDSS